MNDNVKNALASTGTLRAAINLGNFLLVNGRDPSGTPYGVAPDLAAELARQLGVPVQYVCYERPNVLADDAGKDIWDVGLIGAEPARARSIAFTPAYAEIECTYLVPAGSPIRQISDADRAGVRIASVKGAAYDLWLEENLKAAELVHAETLDASFVLFQSRGLEALAGLRPRLQTDSDQMPGARLIDGRFAAVQQAIGTPKSNAAALTFLSEFVADAKRSRLIAGLIEKHSIRGLSVAN